MKRLSVRNVLTGLLVFGFLVSPLLTTRPVSADSLEEKIFFSDNNQIYSLNPDGTNPSVVFDQFSSGFDVSRDGKTIVYDSNFSIWRVNIDGTGQTKLLDAADLQGSAPTWSPDGNKIAFLAPNSDNSGTGIYIMDADGSNRQFIVNGGGAPGPSWSPDGTKILITQQVDGEARLVTTSLDGTDVITVLASTTESWYERTWSPNGDKIVLRSSLNDEPYTAAISTVNLDGSGLTALYTVPSDEGAVMPTWSPDASKILFTKYSASWSGLVTVPSDGGSVTELYEASIPDTPLRWGHVFAGSSDQNPPTASNLRLSRRIVTNLGIAPLSITADAADDSSGVVGGEFYLDNDPGLGNGTQMAYANGQIAAQATVSGLQTGIHALYVRAQDNAGNWSTSVSTRFLYLNL